MPVPSVRIYLQANPIARGPISSSHRANSGLLIPASRVWSPGAGAVRKPSDLRLTSYTYRDWQRTVGNSGVKRMLECSPAGTAKENALKRAPAINDELHLRASLFTQSDQFDRLDAAFHNRPSLTAADNGLAVALYQKALVAAGFHMPRSTTPNGEMDGRWGDETSAVTQRFQADNDIPQGGFEAGRKTLLALDTHLLGAQPSPPQPTPPQPKPPNPQPPTPSVNPELETTLDRIEVAYQNMITRERDGVQAVVRDLTPLDVADPSVASNILRGLLQGTLTFLYGAGEGVLRHIIKDAVNKSGQPSDSTDNLDNANDKVFDAMWAGLTSLINDIVNQGSKDAAESRSNLLADFADDELKIVTQAGFTAFDAFERDGKKNLRQPAAAGDVVSDPGKSGGSPGALPPSVSGDLRVDRARVLLNAINVATASAFDEHYRATLHHWSKAVAQGSAGTKFKAGEFGGGQEQVGTESVIDPQTGQPMRDPDTGEIITKPVMANKRSLDLSALKQNSVTGGLPDIPPGVVEAGMISSLPSDTVRVGDSKADGLSPRTRDKLSNQPVSQLGVPMVALGVFRLPGPQLDDQFLLNAPVVVGINEIGAAFDLTTNSAGVEWITDKGAGNRTVGVGKVADELRKSKIGKIDKV